MVDSQPPLSLPTRGLSRPATPLSSIVSSDCSFSVTVPAGYYIVTCDGFDNSGNSYLYGNDVEAKFTKTSSSYDFPNTLKNIWEFYQGAKTGVIAVKDGKDNLKIGVKRVVEGGWTVVDNIRLYYVGKYGVTLKEGTEDAANWTFSPTSAAEGETVTIKYNGTKKVICNALDAQIVL